MPGSPTIEKVQTAAPKAEAIEMTSHSVPELTPITSLARIALADGSNAVQASFSGAKYAVYDLSSATPTVAVASGTPAVSSVIFNALQTDGYWTADSTGYNFRHTFAGAEFTRAGGSYLIEYALALVSGGEITIQVPVSITDRQQAA